MNNSWQVSLNSSISLSHEHNENPRNIFSTDRTIENAFSSQAQAALCSPENSLQFDTSEKEREFLKELSFYGNLIDAGCQNGDPLLDGCLINAYIWKRKKGGVVESSLSIYIHICIYEYVHICTCIYTLFHCVRDI